MLLVCGDIVSMTIQSCELKTQIAAIFLTF